MVPSTKKLMQYITMAVALLLIAVFAWTSIAANTRSSPVIGVELPYAGYTDNGEQSAMLDETTTATPPMPTVTESGPDLTANNNFTETMSSTAETQSSQNSTQPSQSNTQTAQKTQKPSVTTTKRPTASPLPNNGNLSESVRLYQDAINKARNASGFTAKKAESAKMNINTGEKVSILVATIHVDDFFRNFVAAIRDTNYQYGGGTWSLQTQKTIPKTLNPNQTETLVYKEYGDKNTIAYSDNKYYNLSPKSGSGYNTSSFTSTLRKHDALKMASVGTPSNFLPSASISASDVLSHNYTKNSDGGATIILNISPSAMKKAMYIPDTKAMCAQPYVHNSTISITMTFHEFVTNWQNPRLEMTLNADGYPISIKHTADLGSGSKGTISVATVSNISSDITGNYSMSWTLSNWNKTAKPSKPF